VKEPGGGSSLSIDEILFVLEDQQPFEDIE
jgi:hypothetical protein